MAELPFLPLRVDRLLADTIHMSAEEFGAYCRLLFAMWLNGGTLKNEERELRKICGISAYKFRAIREKILRPMTVVGDTISQKRLTDTWLTVQDVRRKKVEAAAKRWSHADAYPFARRKR